MQVLGPLKRTVTMDSKVATNSRTLHTLNVNPEYRFSGGLRENTTQTTKKKKMNQDERLRKLPEWINRFVRFTKISGFR